MMIVMNLINFCEQTKREGCSVFCITTGETKKYSLSEAIPSTTRIYNHTDINSIETFVKKYILENITTLVEDDVFIMSRLYRNKLYLCISK